MKKKRLDAFQTQFLFHCTPDQFEFGRWVETFHSLCILNRNPSLQLELKTKWIPPSPPHPDLTFFFFKCMSEYDQALDSSPRVLFLKIYLIIFLDWYDNKFKIYIYTRTLHVVLNTSHSSCGICYNLISIPRKGASACLRRTEQSNLSLDPNHIATYYYPYLISINLSKLVYRSLFPLRESVLFSKCTIISNNF